MSKEDHLIYNFVQVDAEENINIGEITSTIVSASFRPSYSLIMSYNGLSVPVTNAIEMSGAGVSSDFVNTAYVQHGGINVMAGAPRYSTSQGGVMLPFSVFGFGYGSRIAETPGERSREPVVAVPSASVGYQNAPHIIPQALAVSNVVRPPQEASPFVQSLLITSEGIQ